MTHTIDRLETSRSRGVRCVCACGWIGPWIPHPLALFLAQEAHASTMLGLGVAEADDEARR